MDRRSFNKLTGVVSTAGMSTAVAANQPNLPHYASTAENSVIPQIPPSGGGDEWELVILDAMPSEVSGMAVDDVDGDGKTEVIIAGNGAILWYRPS